jgi:hypothetical protein
MVLKIDCPNQTNVQNVHKQLPWQQYGSLIP